MGWKDQTSSNDVDGVLSVVETHEMKREIQRCGTASGRVDRAILDKEHVRLHSHVRKAFAQLLCVSPVRRRASTIEKTCLREEKRSATKGHHPGAAAMSSSQSVQHLRIRSRLGRRVARDDDRVRVLELLERSARREGEETLPHPDRARPAYIEFIAVAGQLRPVQAEHLRGDAHLERIGVVNNEHADAMGSAGIFRHVVFLPPLNLPWWCLARCMEDKINLTEALASFDETWSPRNIATVNDYDVRVVHIEGEFVWHKHDDTDELFHVVSGKVQIHLRDRTIELSPGDVYVVPKGVEHNPASTRGADMMLFEPSGTTNTGSTHEQLPGHIQTTSGVAL